MNERIKELISQCWEERKYGPPWFDVDKFANLIVQECVTRIQGCHLAEGYDPEIVGDFELGYKKAIDKVSKQVLLHFGVE